jgi:hypothetical protein
MRILFLILLPGVLLISGCATRFAGGLPAEPAEKIALEALRQQGFPTHREYTLFSKRHRGEWEFQFDFEPKIPGNSMIVWVADDRTTRVLPGNYRP